METNTVKPQVTTRRINLRNILFLTDFSEPSETALPFAVGLTRQYGAMLHVLHVLLPAPYPYMSPDATVLALEAEEECARSRMQEFTRVLNGTAHHVRIVRDTGIWEPVARAVRETEADLIVLGTRGRTGAQKMLMGSVAEEIFRRTTVPVLTIGPGVPNGLLNKALNLAAFRKILLATDFCGPEMKAAPYAISLAEENDARLILLHVMHEAKPGETREETNRATDTSRAKLLDLVPEEAQNWCDIETLVSRGEPAVEILDAAQERDVDLIVLGVHEASGVPGAAIHLGMALAHKVVAHAMCPVLTVRG